MLRNTESKDFGLFLTIEDVEKVSGFTNVRKIPFDPVRFLGSELNFVSDSGKKLLSVDFFSASQFDAYKKITASHSLEILTGVGDEACAGEDPVDRSPILIFKKGQHAVVMNTSAENITSPKQIDLKQLIAIGKIVASRIQ
jgi:hypothetical protein